MLTNVIKNRPFLVVSIISFLIVIPLFFTVYLKFGEIQTPLIIHFDAYRGIDFLGGRMEIYGVLISVIVMIFVNIFLADVLYDRERLLSYILILSNLVLSVLILTGVSVIMSVN